MLRPWPWQSWGWRGNSASIIWLKIQSPILSILHIVNCLVLSKCKIAWSGVTPVTLACNKNEKIESFSYIYSGTQESVQKDKVWGFLTKIDESKSCLKKQIVSYLGDERPRKNLAKFEFFWFLNKMKFQDVGYFLTRNTA